MADDKIFAVKGIWKEENGKRWYELPNGKRLKFNGAKIDEHTAKVRPVVQELTRLLKEFVNDPERDFALFWKDGRYHASYGHKSFLFEDINGSDSDKSSSK